jgi:hypothetical protein
MRLISWTLRSGSEQYLQERVIEDTEPRREELELEDKKPPYIEGGKAEKRFKVGESQGERSSESPGPIEDHQVENEADQVASTEKREAEASSSSR